MARNISTPAAPNGTDSGPPYDAYDPALDEDQPSLIIILLSAACGVGAGVIGLYVTYTVLAWDAPPSVFVAVLAMSLTLGVVGAGLSIVTASRAAIKNIAFSCGLVLIAGIFLGLCMLAGAVAAALLLVSQ